MSSFPPGLPPYAITFGPDANCTLTTCPVVYSVYGYRPNLAANVIFLVLFALSMAVHAYLGYRWRQWFFAAFMMVGSLIEVVGYVGRIILYNNPFDFIGFMLQIVLITCGPVFYTAAIYVTLSKSIRALAPEVSRFRPEIFYYVFIPADVICLVLQAAGGALSTVSSGSSQTGVDIALAGLILQVVVLAFFIVALSDYLIRYFRSGANGAWNRRTRIYFSFLGLAVILILGRCIYRAYELSKGYQDSDLIRDEGLFIGLEGVLVLVACYSLCIGHPGLILSPKSTNSIQNTPSRSESMVEAKGRKLATAEAV